MKVKCIYNKLGYHFEVGQWYRLWKNGDMYWISFDDSTNGTLGTLPLWPSHFDKKKKVWKVQDDNDGYEIHFIQKDDLREEKLKQLGI